MNENQPKPDYVAVVELAPYRERRRTRRFAAGLLVGYLAGAWLLPALAELAGDLLDTVTEPARAAG